MTKTANEIRQEFIDFFKDKQHTEVLSSPVIPYDDPTILFTIAGMTQFKDVFLGEGKRDYSRAVNSQKCIRAGGKQNDLDEVGRDNYHHSFFEMLGNWSFGDYYKKEIIAWAWELLTEKWGLDKSKLFATVYTTDDDADNFWKSETDIAHVNISRHEADNFWTMGDTGPCGPCSEIHYDRGESFCTQKEDPDHVCEVNGDCGRIIEIWNLVFIQYNRNKAGELLDLPKKHVDTGMGFERICSIIQEKDSNYHIDSFRKIIAKIEEVTGKKYHSDDRGIPFRVIADHMRALLFSISDGAIPSNEKRGYVLRRILRRAARFGFKLGMNETFLYKIIPTVSEVMKDAFPETEKYKKHAQNIVKAEEISFSRTLKKGIDLFNKIVEDLKSDNATNLITGTDAFKLYDTFGFPLDLTKQMAEEISFEIDEIGFNSEMKKQKELARKNKKFIAKENIEWIVTNENYSKTEFVGYDKFEGDSKIVKYFIDNEKKILKVIPNKSYFYAESGGQVSDTGYLSISNVQYPISNIQKDANYFVISVKFKDNELPPLDEETIITQNINLDFRNKCRKYHSATHLLHSAIKKVLGGTVTQSGSFVSDKTLRFDYSFYEKLKKEQIENIEFFVNDNISKNLEIITTVDSLENAKKKNVTALFGEKYGDTVRIVTIGNNVSSELCGGTHANRTGDIGYFKITVETSVASGVRRIEALCSTDAVKYAREQQFIVENLRESLVCKENMILERFNKLSLDKKNLEKEMISLNEKIAISQVEDLIKNKQKELNGVQYIAEVLENVSDAKILKTMAEQARTKTATNTIILLAADIKDKASLVCAVTDDLKMQYKAGQIISNAAKIVGGGGGGAPHLATAGGKDITKLQDAIDVLKELLGK